MKDLVIICSTIPARHNLLRRSVQTWQQSIESSGLDADILIWSEGCDLYDFFSTMPPADNVYYQGREDFSGSHIFGYNYWYSKIKAKVYLLTHPDILYPKDTVATAFARAVDNTFVAFKTFWMGERFTNDINLYQWRTPEVLEHEKMLHEDDPKTHGEFYFNTNVRNITCWESTTTFAINRQTAERMYPLPDFGSQGADDPFQAGLRQRLSVTNYTVMNPILFHQWHPNSWHGTAEDAVRDAQEALQKRFSQQ